LRAEDKQYDLVSGDKRINELNKQIKEINDALTKGTYVPKNAGDPNFSAPNKTVRVPQFSDAYNNLIELRNTLQSEQTRITQQLAVKAQTYAPPAGPQTAIIKQELQLQKKYGTVQTATVPTTPAAGTFRVPVPRGVTPGELVKPEPPLGGDRGGAAAPKPVTKADVDATLASSGLPDTPQNRKDIREQMKAGKKAPSNWEALVTTQAGEYAYLLDPKFEGVADLLRKAVQQEWFKSEEGKAQFLQELKKTPYGLNTSKNQQGFDVKTPAEKQLAVQAQIDKIRGEYGEIQFDQNTLEEVAGVAARNGSSDVELGRLVYRAAFKRGAVSPDFTTPTAAKTALGGNDADRIRAIYRAYGQRPNDEQISRILAQETDPASGTVMTEDMLRNNLRDLAKVSYSPFADLLDRGVSVETIFSPYQQIAARVLEKSADQVAFLDENGVPTQFASALMGEKPMSLTDWITKLKSDDRYGWQFTTEAKQQATSLVMDLEKKFGYRA
jgi:hypothetical protein